MTTAERETPQQSLSASETHLPADQPAPASRSTPLGTLSVGCAMWANRAWVGPYFPADTKAGRELEVYATWCTAVEGNTTFYATPDPAVAHRWAERVQPGFRFVCKLPRAVTHDRRLRNAEADLEPFLAAMDALRAVLGPLAVQLPASFAPEDLPALLRFLDSVPTSFAWSVEVRHPGFFRGSPAERELNDELHARGVDRIIMDTRALFDGPRETPEEVDAFDKKPRLEVKPVALAKQPVVRFIGQRDLSTNRTYWERWLPAVIRWLRDGRSPIVFLHTPDNRDALPMAREFHAAVRAQLPELSELPEPTQPGRQVALFDDNAEG